MDALLSAVTLSRKTLFEMRKYRMEYFKQHYTDESLVSGNDKQYVGSGEARLLAVSSDSESELSSTAWAAYDNPGSIASNEFSGTSAEVSIIPMLQTHIRPYSLTIPTDSLFDSHQVVHTMDAVEASTQPSFRRRVCHHCGNVRKLSHFCDNERCPHVFCLRCKGKLESVYGKSCFVLQCPVCAKLCCCAIKSLHCHRELHCYRKCLRSKSMFNSRRRKINSDEVKDSLATLSTVAL